ncbi:hypothetical protein A1O1_07143 [Capronia coronata CBS 617.96]|uniref:FAD-binding FR-type domain-containing protein n=1 Tax=Capronia coronata CBS 617.96 TaxID=1182541 RepID=W9Y1K9_9EURO|nr:uncharacterized protein A1O1_07143 [Capronia coronata CBS 617.96]EXJ83520.1 hypothetical protein A1O1_07143 [Capronia coronata CBS 617.96]
MQGRLLGVVTALSLAVPIICDPASCVSACQLTLSKIVFEDTAPDLPYYVGQCTSSLRIKSTYICSREFCPAREIQPGLDALNQTCIRYGGTALPPFSSISNITSGDVRSQFQVIERSDFLTHSKVNRPAIPSRSLFEDGLRTTEAYNISMGSSVLYAIAMFVFWTLVVAVGLGFRLFRFLNQNRDPKHNSQHQHSTALSPYSTFYQDMKRRIKQHVLIPAAFSRHCAEPLGWWIVPPRLQSLTILSFILLNTVLTFGHYDVFSGNLYWSNPRLQYARYIGDRTGVMGTANLTLIYLFATRNNLLLWITGWSFETFMQFHRWVARVSTVQAIIHSLAYTIYVLVEGGVQHYWSVWRQRYWYWGGIATICMGLLLVFSLYPVRSRLYELFLFLHMTLAVMVLVGMWYHVAIFDGAYNVLLWPCFVVWIADRAMRLARVVRCNLPYRASLATYSPDTDVVWITVPRVVAPSAVPHPGAYYFLYLLHGTTWYESHPFTLSGWELGDQEDEQQLPDTTATATKKENKNRQIQINLQFVIRPYDGLTSRLRDLVRRQTGESKTGRRLRVLIEGPYGPNHNLCRYDTIAFIVGGTGIAIALAYLSNMLDLALARQNKGEGQGYRVQHLHLVWAVKEPSFFQETFDRELKPRLTEIAQLSGRQLDISVQIYNTRAAAPAQTLVDEPGNGMDSSEMEPMVPSGMTSDSRYQPTEWESDEHSPLSASARTVTPDGIRVSMFNHRPRLENVVLRCASAEDGEKRICAIVACCPAGMADATRSAVVKAIAMGQGCAGIDFYPESYAW